MGKTAKVKSAGRFGSRYGVGIRKRVIKIEKAQRAKHRCPECGFDKIKRTATGIYECGKCSVRFAGGAYVPETMSGSIVRKMVTQKAFLPNAKNLLEIKGASAVEVTEKAAEKQPVAEAPVAEENTEAKEKKAKKAKPKAEKEEKVKIKPKAKKPRAEKPKVEKKKKAEKKEPKPKAKKAVGKEKAEKKEKKKAK